MPSRPTSPAPTMIPLGAHVSATHIWTRMERAGSDGKWFKSWWAKAQPVTGYFMGFRKMNNGYTQWLGDGNGWKTTDTVWAALVVFNPYRSPILCVPSTVTIHGEEDNDN